MKKITVVVLMFIYGLSSSGTSVHADYCCGKLSKLSLSLSQAENSKQNTQLATKRCCGYKEVNFKLKTDHETYTNQTIDFSIYPIAIPVFCTVEFKTNELSKHLKCYSTGPPLHSPSDLFIKHCSFRI